MVRLRLMGIFSQECPKHVTLFHFKSSRGKKRFCENFNQLSYSAKSSSIPASHPFLSLCRKFKHHIPLKITSMQHACISRSVCKHKEKCSIFFFFFFFFSPFLPDIIILDVDQIICGFMERFERRKKIYLTEMLLEANIWKVCSMFATSFDTRVMFVRSSEFTIIFINASQTSILGR